MNLTIRKTIWLMLAVIFSVLIVACGGEDTRPSEDKVKLDLQDRLDANFKGLVHLEKLDITKRDVLAEDRVNLGITMTLTVNESEVDQAIQQYWARQQIMRSYNSPPNKERLMAMNKKQEKATIQYRKQAGNVWALSGLVPR
ncbi:hypothetical protein [Salinicola endophyticus]|uniref:hypothetical protein n=1 Tax=Salinicola endophyticus TaxID=1949083 RepID=UPI000DA16417|nr:hypothetical protein [Salinicola endophyticus]